MPHNFSLFELRHEIQGNVRAKIEDFHPVLFIHGHLGEWLQIIPFSFWANDPSVLVDEPTWETSVAAGKLQRSAKNDYFKFFAAHGQPFPSALHPSLLIEEVRNANGIDSLMTV